jgi:hypothetical protein
MGSHLKATFCPICVTSWLEFWLTPGSMLPVGDTEGQKREQKLGIKNLDKRTVEIFQTPLGLTCTQETKDHPAEGPSDDTCVQVSKA